MQKIIYSFFLFLLVSCATTTNYRYISQESPSQQNCSKLILSFDAEFQNHPKKDIFRRAKDFYHFKSASKEYDVQEEVLLNLSMDPAHANIVEKKSIDEATAIIKAERKALIAGPISRGNAEIDFLDSNLQAWDIKSPRSPRTTENWSFNKVEVINSLTHQLEFEYIEDGVTKNVNVLIDFRATKIRERKIIRNWIDNHFSEEYRNRIRYIN